jgi:hypothetical protein
MQGCARQENGAQLVSSLACREIERVTGELD